MHGGNGIHGDQGGYSAEAEFHPSLPGHFMQDPHCETVIVAGEDEIKCATQHSGAKCEDFKSRRGPMGSTCNANFAFRQGGHVAMYACMQAYYACMHACMHTATRAAATKATTATTTSTSQPEGTNSSVRASPPSGGNPNYEGASVFQFLNYPTLCGQDTWNTAD